MDEFVRGSHQTILTHSMSVILVLALMFLIGGLVSASRLPRSVKVLVWVALLFRLVGAVSRFEVLQRVYGAGDATGYFGKGWRYAESFRRFDFSPFTQGAEWHGTGFVRSVSGLVLAVIGPGMFAEFLVFSLFAFVGLVGFAVAFHRAYPDAPLTRYLLWIWIFPSLWFWPASIGKEALVLMGLGLAVMGFVGRRGRVHWPVLAFGLFLMFAVRPQVVAVFLLAVIIAQWLSFDGRWTLGRIVQGALIIVLGFTGISFTMRTLGIEEFDVEGVQSYVETDTSRRVTRGTSVGEVAPGLKGAPKAAVNVLFRPLPWEATNMMVLISSIEILSLWAIVYMRRKALARSLRHWRTDRTLRLAIVFILAYSVALGMMVMNLGIIARQRIFLYPFLFLLIEADTSGFLNRARERLPWTRSTRRLQAGTGRPYAWEPDPL